MNIKRYIAASVAVFVVQQLLNFLIHGVILKAAYESTKSIWRPDMASKMWILTLTTFILSFLFTLIFVKGYEGKGIKEGLRFGLLIGLFISLPVSYENYVVLPIPYLLALQWFLYGTIAWMFMGAMAAIVYRPKTANS